MGNRSHPKVDVQHVIAAYGGKSKMSESFNGLTRQAIEQWDEIPVRWVLKIESDTGYSRHQQRPDVYGAKPAFVDPKPIPRIENAKRKIARIAKKRAMA